jgi:hypothetical protein
MTHRNRPRSKADNTWPADTAAETKRFSIAWGTQRVCELIIRAGCPTWAQKQSLVAAAMDAPPPAGARWGQSHYKRPRTPRFKALDIGFPGCARNYCPSILHIAFPGCRSPHSDAEHY